MIVMEKRRTSAVLKADGCAGPQRRRDLRRQGPSDRLLRTARAFFSAISLVSRSIATEFHRLPEGVFYVSTLPVRIVASNFRDG